MSWPAIIAQLENGVTMTFLEAILQKFEELRVERPEDEDQILALMDRFTGFCSPNATIDLNE